MLLTNSEDVSNSWGYVQLVGGKYDAEEKIYGIAYLTNMNGYGLIDVGLIERFDASDIEDAEWIFIQKEDDNLKINRIFASAILFLSLFLISCEKNGGANRNAAISEIEQGGNQIVHELPQIIKENFYMKNMIYEVMEKGISEDTFISFQSNNQSLDTDWSGNDAEEVIISLYREFLDGKREIDGLSINELTIPTGEEGRRYPAKYAFWDSNGDSIPELHVDSAHYYYVFSFRSGELFVWKDFTGSNCFPLKDGGFIFWSIGVFKDDLYNYHTYDYNGQENYGFCFSWDDLNDNKIHDKEDEYLFDDQSVTQDQWNKLTQKYLYQDENGAWKIANEIEWTILYEGK